MALCVNNWKVSKADNGCLIWLGHLGGKKGRVPLIFKERRAMSVPRLVYANAHPLENIKGKIIIRTCGNCQCVNPEHLKPVSRAEIGKEPIFKSSLQPKRKLTLEQLAYVKQRLVEGGISQSALARELGVTASAICQINAKLKESNHNS